MRIRPDVARLKIADVKEVALSLSGCGFLGTYHIGASFCLYKHGKLMMSKVTRVGGASAGALVASLLALRPESLLKGLATFYKMAHELHRLPYGALTPGYVLQKRLLEIVDEHIPEDISAAQGRLMISLTNYKTMRNELVTKFRDREHLIELLLASCYIPGYSKGFQADFPKIDGNTYFDGFYANNLPDWSDIKTITVSPFSGNADIAPNDPPPFTYPWAFDFGKHLIRANLRNLIRGKHALFPPPVDVLRQYYRQGFTDAHTFLKINHLTDVQLTEELLKDEYLSE
ncbi:unnamed protein product, partial [Mesorhabditis belari]|uniref:PNPLA domain-containing protein n=1 Tax=Mesorhabditis belari TaxID=2138241 RepID=A0AAF3EKU6_9BILA